MVEDFSRKRHRKVSTPRSKESARKGFASKAPIGTNVPKRDPQKNGIREVSNVPTLSEFEGLVNKTPEAKFGSEETAVDSVDDKVEDDFLGESEIEEEEVDQIGKSFVVAESSQLAENGSVGHVENVAVLEKDETSLNDVKSVEDVYALEKEESFETDYEDVSDESVLEPNIADGDEAELQKIEMVLRTDSEDLNDEQSVASQKLRLEIEARLMSEMEGKMKAEMEAKLKAEVEAKMKAEMEAKVKAEIEEKMKEEMEAKMKLEAEAKFHREEIERLADMSFFTENKMFVYPKVVKPDEEIELFLNKKLSPLKDESDILMMGAFNDWRWKSFTRRLNKIDLRGDWWSCRLHVPKEAYKIDFVFFNGKDVYDNNEEKDFCITVEGGMDVFAFEDFLLEEKRREQEKLAKEQAERERQEEEQRRIEAEKAATEADRAQAKVEVDKQREILHQVMEKAEKLVENVWYIEPGEFQCNDLIRIYYSRKSGPLAHASELWIHGGYNNWRDGLTIVGKLEVSERVEGDWWYAEGTYKYKYILILSLCFLLIF